MKSSPLSRINDEIQHWLQEKGVAGLGISQSQSLPKRRGRSTPTAKRTPKIWYLALGFMFFIDHAAAKAKPEPINARNATRSRVATFVRSFSTSAATLPLPLFRLTSLRARAGAAQLLFVLGKNLWCEFSYSALYSHARVHYSNKAGPFGVLVHPTINSS
jgi:hypothetical protein